ncbi:MAG: TlpA disulfide reductase family protein [Flavihumibacter sp.]
MRHTIGLLIVLLAAGGAFAQGNDIVHIKGEAVNLSNNSRVYLQRYENKMFFVIDSTTVSKGQFNFSKELPLPELYGITDNPSELSTLFLFIQGRSDIAVRYDTSDGGRRSVISGSEAADRYKAYQKNARDLNLDSFIREDPASIVTAFVLYRYYSPSLLPDDIERYTRLLDPSLENTQYVKLLRELPATLRATGIGSQAPDIALPNPEGKTVRLSDYYGRYVLVDFWAAWCVPCRRENPNVVRVYNRYKDKGFTVFGVSLDSKKEAWVKAIAQDGLNWPQVSDLKFWDSDPAKRYGIRGIPGNVLLDRSGKIIARNLRGEELEKKIASLLP